VAHKVRVLFSLLWRVHVYGIVIYKLYTGGRARRAARGHRRRATRTDRTLPPRAGGGGGGGGGEGYYALWRIERVAEALRAVETARGWRRYCGVQRRDRVESLVFSGAYSRTPCIFVSGCEGSSMQYCVASQLRRVAQVRRKYNVVKPNHIISYRLACHPGSLSARCVVKTFRAA